MTRKIQLLASFLLITSISFAQVGIGTVSPDASAALDVTATDKGFLMPRMSSAQRAAIASPAIGLQVYDLDTKSTWSYDGTAWMEGVGGGGKFVDGAAADIAYYDGRVGIGRNAFSTAHKLYVEGIKATDGTNTATRIDAIYTGTGTSIATYGMGVSAVNSGSGTIDYAIGTQEFVRNNNAGGTINIGVGIWPQIYNIGTMGYTAASNSYIENSGTMTTAVGQNAEVRNLSTMTDAYAGWLDFVNTGTIGNAYGSYIDFSGNTGTVTNSYGLYITSNFNRGASDNFAIYSASDADSYVNGNLGVGTETPQQKVHISGAMRLEPQATSPTGSLGDLYVGTDGNLYFHDGTSWKQVQLVP
jgi:hypothetical protein